MQKYLAVSKKSSTFAPAFEKQSISPSGELLNGVMVALQILVLSVWVRVLVEQQKKSDYLSVVAFFAYIKDENPPFGAPEDF